MTPFSKTPNKKLDQVRDMFTNDEMKISDPKAVETAADLAAENARLQKETGDVVDYYTRTVEELQAENMRLRGALQDKLPCSLSNPDFATDLEMIASVIAEIGYDATAGDLVTKAATIRATLAGGE